MLRIFRLRPSDLLTSAENLVPAGPGRPLESDLRRAVSTVYYALFHSLAECCADEFFNKNMRGQPGWVRTYRALNHRRAEEACRVRRDMLSFCVEIRDFASHFVDLQDQRHRADYDPVATFYKSDVQRLIVDSRAVLREFERADRRERRAFAALVLFRARN